jgi:hypothetical protein
LKKKTLQRATHATGTSTKLPAFGLAFFWAQGQTALLATCGFIPIWHTAILYTV